MSILMVLQIMWGWDRWQLIHLYYGVGGGTKDGYHLIAIFFLVLLYFVVSCSQSLYLGG